MAEKRKLELSEQQTRVVQAVKGLEMFSKEYIFKNYYNFNDREIEEVNQQREDETAADQEQQAAAQGGMPGAAPSPGGPPSPAPGGSPSPAPAPAPAGPDQGGGPGGLGGKPKDTPE